MSDAARFAALFPTVSGSRAEADTLMAVAERTRGERIGAVGDVPRWGPEAAVSLAGCLLAWAGRVDPQRMPAAVVGCTALALLLVAQLAGVRWLDAVLARAPTWAVALGPVRAASPVLVLPTDRPAPALGLARALLALLLVALPWAFPWAPLWAAALLLVPGALAFLPGARPAVWGWFCDAAHVAREHEAAVMLAGASRRDARGVIGALDWKRAEGAPVVWVVGSGGGVVHVPTGAPWRMSGPARRWLLDPAVLRLHRHGHPVWVVGMPQGAPFDPGAHARRWATPLAVAVAWALEQAGAAGPRASTPRPV